MRIISKVAGILTIMIGIIMKTKPRLLLKFPKYGFILYAIAGQGVPPYFYKATYKEGNTNWLRDNDVIVSVGAKCGTTWMLYCSHQIRVKGNDINYPFGDVSYSTICPEFLQHPSHSWEEQLEMFNSTVLPDGKPLKEYWDHPDYPFRIFKSHFSPDLFEGLFDKGNGVKKHIKFVAMARNGLDQAASLVPFGSAHTDLFRDQWGGFPPVPHDEKKHKSNTIRDLLPGGLLYDLHFEYINKWWDLRNEDNVLLLHYADAKRDLKGTVKKLSDFYGVHLTKSELKKVVQKCEFSHMKKNSGLFNYKLPLFPDFNGTQSALKDGGLVRNGQNGNGKLMFSEKDKEKWRRAEEKLFGNNPEKLSWARNGEAYESS